MQSHEREFLFTCLDSRESICRCALKHDRVITGRIIKQAITVSIVRCY